MGKRYSATPRAKDRRGARGASPRQYHDGKLVVLGVRLPELHRRQLDYVALVAGTTPSMLGRMAIERLLLDMGFTDRLAPEVLPDLVRAKIAAWLVAPPEPETAHGTELAPGAGTPST